MCGHSRDRWGSMSVEGKEHHQHRGCDSRFIEGRTPLQGGTGFDCLVCLETGAILPAAVRSLTQELKITASSSGLCGGTAGEDHLLRRTEERQETNGVVFCF